MHADREAPEGFAFCRDGGILCLVRRGDDRVVAPLSASLRGASLDGGSDAGLRGRGAVGVAAVPGREQEGARMVVRLYRHGGALRFLGTRLVLGAHRPFAELRALAAAEAAGVAVVRPLAALSTRVAPGISRGLLATEKEEGAIDLLEWFRSPFSTSPSSSSAPTLVRARAERREVATRLAREVRRLHDAGIFHADLHVKNVLVRPGPGPGKKIGVVLVDFDRARVFSAPLPPRLRFQNLFRLDRSLEKTGLSPKLVSRTDRVACLRAYLDPDVGRLARAPGLKARLFWGRVALAFHRLSWRLGGTPA